MSALLTTGSPSHAMRPSRIVSGPVTARPAGPWMRVRCVTNTIGPVLPDFGSILATSCSRRTLSPIRKGASWKVNLFRLERVRSPDKSRVVKSEASAWSTPLSGDFHNLDRFATITFVE